MEGRSAERLFDSREETKEDWRMRKERDQAERYTIGDESKLVVSCRNARDSRAEDFKSDRCSPASHACFFETSCETIIRRQLELLFGLTTAHIGGEDKCCRWSRPALIEICSHDRFTAGSISCTTRFCQQRSRSHCSIFAKRATAQRSHVSCRGKRAT